MSCAIRIQMSVWGVTLSWIFSDFDRHCFRWMISTDITRSCLCDALLLAMLNEWWNNSDEFKNEFNLWASRLRGGISSNCQQVMWKHSNFSCPTLHIYACTIAVYSSQVWYDLYGPARVRLEDTEGFLHEYTASKPAGRTPRAGARLDFFAQV